MKVVAILVCALFVAQALNINSVDFTSTERNHLSKIYSTNWGKFVMNYAQVHLSTGGYLDDLLVSIEQLISDLSEEMHTIEKNYQRRTNEHNRDVVRLEQEIADAAREIFNGNDMIDNVLHPTRIRF
jgi:hydrogenase maturation factor